MLLTILSVHRRRFSLVGKPEVQPLVTLILRCPQVMIFLSTAHGVPNSVSGLVTTHVVDLDENGHDRVPADEGEKDNVATPVQWSVIFAVNLH